MNYEIIKPSGVVQDDRAFTLRQANTTGTVSFSPFDDSVDWGSDYSLGIRFLPGNDYELGPYSENYLKMYEDDDAYDNNTQIGITVSDYEGGPRTLVNIDPGNLFRVKLNIAPQGGQTSPTTSNRSIPVVLQYEQKTGTVNLMANNGFTRQTDGNGNLTNIYQKTINIPPHQDEVIAYMATTLDPNQATGHLYGFSAAIQGESFGDDADYIFRPHLYGAKECVEKNIPRGTTCGEGGRQFMIAYQHDPNVAQDEDALSFYVYASPSRYTREKIRAVWRGKNTTGGSVINTGSEVFTIEPEGSVIKIPFDRGDQWDDTIDIMFEPANSLYDVRSKYRHHTIKVRDNDPTYWQWVENTLEQPDENGFTKIFKVLLLKSPLLTIPDNATWEFDFNISGCDVVANNPVNDSTEYDVLPCYIGVYGATKDSTEGDQFISGRQFGLTVEFAVGEDNNTVDEAITFDPILTVGSGGEVI